MDRQVFHAEWTDEKGSSFFRAPERFRDKLVWEGGCKALVRAPDGAPENLPELKLLDPVVDGTNERVLNLQQELSVERSAISAMRAELGATLHERDRLKLQVHELTEEINELRSKMEDEGIEAEG